MSPAAAATFARAAVRPFSAPAMSSSTTAALVRRMTTGPARPFTSKMAAANATTTASTTRTTSALPSFSTASFMAASFRRASQRARQQGGAGSRRWQSSTAGADAGAAPKASWFQRMWDSPVGLKTVHFWAPIMKWVLVLAGVSDFARPAEKLSATQNIALTATGLIWTRWCLIIKPKNYLLAAVNFFLGIVGVVQCGRIAFYWQSVRSGKIPPPAPEAAAEPAKE